MEYIPSYIDQLDVDFLCHHGIKGMKWGVRRPRNEDGILAGAGKGLAARMKSRRQLKKDAKAEYKNTVAKNKQRFQDWSKKADARYARDEKYRKSGQIGVEAEREVSRLQTANKAAKRKYKQTVNADRIARADAKAHAYQRAASRNKSMRKYLKKQNLGVRLATAPASLAYGGNQLINQTMANHYTRKTNRLSR